MSKIVMGMFFQDETKIPDFGSIRMTKLGYRSKNEYLLKSEDIDKLDLITNASDGSIALCVDTAELYLLYLGEWKKWGKIDG